MHSANGNIGRFVQKPTAATAIVYVNADFDTIEIALSSRKGLEKAWNKGFRGQSLASEALFCFMEFCGVSLLPGGNLPCKTAVRGIIKKCR